MGGREGGGEGGAIECTRDQEIGQESTKEKEAGSLYIHVYARENESTLSF